MKPPIPVPPSKSLESTTDVKIIIDIIYDLSGDNDSSSISASLVERESEWWSNVERRETLERYLCTDDKSADALQRCVSVVQKRMESSNWGDASENQKDQSVVAGTTSNAEANTSERFGREIFDVCAAIRLIQLTCGKNIYLQPLRGILSSKLSEKNCTLMGLELLKSTSHSVVSMVQSRPSNSSLRLAHFVIQLFIKIINPLIESSPFFIPPLWKGICSIISSLHNSNNLDREILEESVKELMIFICEGETQIKNMSFTYIKNHQHSQRSNKKCGVILETDFLQQLKVLQFFVTRLGTLLPIGVSLRKYGRAQNSIFPELKVIITVLSRISGLHSAILMLLEQPEDEKMIAILKLVQQLSLKADHCLVNILFMSKDSKYCGINETSLSLLIANKNTIDNGRNQQFDNQWQFSNSAFSLGKLQTLQFTLSNMTSFAGTALVESHACDINYMDHALAICEEIIFSTLPMCHACLAGQIPTVSHCSATKNTNLKILSLTIDLVVDCTILCERLPYIHIKSSKQIQYLFARWLSPVGGGNDDDHISSLTQQTVIAIVNVHIVRSTFYDSGTNIPLNKYFAAFLTSFLSKLLFDDRIDVTHRKNIATILYRLLICSATKSKDSHKKSLELVSKLTEAALEKEFHRKTLRKTNRIKNFGGRKRRRGTLNTNCLLERMQMWPMNDIRAISPLLEVLFSRDHFWLTADETTCAHLQKACCAFLQEGEDDCSQNKYQQCNKISTAYSHNSLHVTLVLLTSAMSTKGPELKQKLGLEIEKLEEAFFSLLSEYCKRMDSGTIQSDGLIHNLFRYIIVCMSNTQQVFSPALLYHLKEILSVADIQIKKDGTIPLTFSLILFLSEVGSILGSDDRLNLLSSVPSLFTSALSSKWPSIALAMTSMVRFASTISVKYQEILPRCVPKSVQFLLQCRLKKEVCWFLSCRIDLDAIQRLKLRWSENFIFLFHALNEVGRRRKNTLLSDVIVQPYSNVLKLRTSDTQSDVALIILSPKADSALMEKIVDFGSKLGIIEISSLSRVGLIEKGSGCLFSIKKG